VRRDGDRRPTLQRGYGAPDHRPPSGKHARGREHATPWKGTSRIVDRAERRRANRRSWGKVLAEARRETVAARASTDERSAA
jgi:hypothetical protein